jgi:hypothetical protein
MTDGQDTDNTSVSKEEEEKTPLEEEGGHR